VPLGSSGLEISPIGIGTWAWGNKLLWDYDPSNDGKLQEAFDAAVDLGVTFFDTGDSYGTGALEGRAEILLGRFQRQYASRSAAHAKRASRIVVGTKLATYPWRITAASMEDALR
jgi:pyridoxine 4-dehydrogenase